MPKLKSWKDLFNGKGYRSALRGTIGYLFGKRGERFVSGMRNYYWLRMQVMTRSSESIGKLTRNRQVHIWVDGRESFDRLEKLIRLARHSIFIQMFIWKDDSTGRRIASLLTEAADRGVRVTITKEAVGDFFEFRGDFLGTKDSLSPLWKRFWNHPRIQVTHGTHNDHAKVYVFDDDILVLTGMNVADEYRFRLHDYMVELHGSSFVKQYLTRTPDPADAKKDVQLVMNTEHVKMMREAMEGLLREAKEFVVVEFSYISDPHITDMLIDLSNKGVRVTVIIPSYVDFHHHANMAAVGRIIAEGDSANVRAFIYKDMFHGKVLLVDQNAACIGSANLMKSSLDEMGEVNVVIRGKHRALWKIREALRHDVLVSKALSSPPPLLWISRWLSWLGL